MTDSGPRFLRRVARGLFTPIGPVLRGPGAVAVELELIPRTATGGALALDDSTLVELTRERGSGGKFSFEPGGQLELSTPALPTISTLADALRHTLDPLVASACAAGIELDARGLATRFGPGDVGLRRREPRYAVMDRYLGRIGPWGAWMMRCTASLQVNLDLGPPGTAAARWRVANLLGPVLVAAFANAAADLPDGTPVVSGRDWIWRQLDPGRTGAVAGADDPAPPWEGYLAFALRAPVMFDAATRPVRLPDGRIPSFGEWLAEASAAPTVEDWRAHLGALFPDVRPRGWLEIRPIDVPARDWWSVPPALLAALLYDGRARREAEEMLRALHATSQLTDRAHRHGLRDGALRTAAAGAFELAEDAMSRMPVGFFGNAHRSTAAFRERYVEAGRTQADEAREAGEVARLETAALPSPGGGVPSPPRAA